MTDEFVTKGAQELVSDVQRPQEPAVPTPDLTVPPEPLRRFWRQQATPDGLLARGRNGAFTPIKWEAYVDEAGQAYLTLHSRKPGATPPVVIIGAKADLLALLEAAYWGVRDAVEEVEATPVEK